MLRRTVLTLAAVAILAGVRALPRGSSVEVDGSSLRLPARLTAPELWRLSAALSEPDGFFRSDNLVSNEIAMQQVVPDLLKLANPARAYVGVGPEQNFTYIAALDPAMAFIIDIRRGNLHVHLMYRALFQLSVDRADFVSRLFSMTRPPGLTDRSTGQALFAAYADPSLRSEALYTRNAAAIRDLYVKTLRAPISEADLQGIEQVYRQFFDRGLDVQYEVTPGTGFGGRFPGYGELMTATDEEGVPRSFLASEANFARVKALEERNLVVPVVGDFAGPKAIRAVGRYLKARGTTVSAFYVSNVEQYLGREGLLDKFCENASTLPIDASSTFIRSQRGGFGPFRGGPSGRGGFAGGFLTQLFNMQADLRACSAAAR